jgi:hypothetical protein
LQERRDDPWPNALRVRTEPHVASRIPLTFYVDATTGNDKSPGTSPQQPWKTIKRVDKEHLEGGDQVLFAGGEDFKGTLRLSPATLSITSPNSPLTIGSFGPTTPAVIDAGHKSGILAVNVSGVHITNLKVTGTSTKCHPTTYGIFFDVRTKIGLLQDGITIDHVETSGFCDGIAIGSEDDRSQIANIKIDSVISHDNVDAGVLTYDPALKNHDVHNVTVTGSQAYRNANQGGIVLFGVNQGLVEHSVAWGNGARASGDVGIWAFDATGITIQYNESYGNLTTGDDGDGFDFDGGVSNSVMQYNYAHDDAGIGLLVCGCVNFYEMHNDVVRYNVAVNDGSSGQPSGLYVLGGEPFSNVDIYNNTVVSGSGSGPLVVVDANGAPLDSLHLRNNLFVTTTNNKLLLQEPSPSENTDVAFQANDWWSQKGPWSVQWDKSTYSSLTSWIAAAGAEQLNGSTVGVSANPLVCNLGSGGTEWPNPPAQLSAYFLQANSPLIDAGIDLPKQFGIDVGANDLAGSPVLSGSGYDIGASERQPGETC